MFSNFSSIRSLTHHLKSATFLSGKYGALSSVNAKRYLSDGAPTVNQVTTQFALALKQHEELIKGMVEKSHQEVDKKITEETKKLASQIESQKESFSQELLGISSKITEESKRALEAQSSILAGEIQSVSEKLQACVKTTDEKIAFIDKTLDQEKKDLYQKISVEIESLKDKTDKGIASIKNNLDEQMKEVSKGYIKLMFAIAVPIIGFGVAAFFSDKKKIEVLEEEMAKIREDSRNTTPPSTGGVVAVPGGLESNNEENERRSMVVFFQDTSDTDYDKRIDALRVSVESHDVCKAFEDFDECFRDLERMRTEYWPRPCKEGGCLGVFTPHRDRIDRRMNVLKDEQKVYKSLCDARVGRR